jgi:F-type H+-transporting ATPase subunit gamma
MPSLKALRKRIASVRSTQQITKAMKMVSAAKLRRAQEAALAARPYARKLGELLGNLTAWLPADAHPLLRQPAEVRRVHLLLITADRGLCGAYNSNLIRQAEAFLREHRDRQPSLTLVGRKGVEHFRRRRAEIAEQFVGIGNPTFELARKIAAGLAARYASGATDRVVVLYSAFRSALSQVPTVETLLPIAPVGRPGAGPAPEYLVEPGRVAVLGRLLPRYLEVAVFGALLEAAASEHGARMTAMDSATNNAAEMIFSLTLQMNRARQAAITKELMEIVSGAEALKG